ncbi:MAG: TetR/AcrR family transcriptional regulator [Candidatus Geothermincolia bacterium]
MAKSLGKRRNLVKDERETDIKAAALKIFSGKGYHRSTMAEIAVEAGFGKGTIYWYWKSKEDLYFALISDLHGEILRMMEEGRQLAAQPLEKMAYVANGMVDIYYRDRDYCKLSWRMRAEELQAFSPEHVAGLHEYVTRTRASLEEMLVEAQAEGLFPGQDPYYLACLILGMVEGMEIQWLEDQGTFDLRQGMQVALQLLAGIATAASPPRPQKGKRGAS